MLLEFTKVLTSSRHFSELLGTKSKFVSKMLGNQVFKNTFET